MNTRQQRKRISSAPDTRASSESTDLKQKTRGGKDPDGNETENNWDYQSNEASPKCNCPCHPRAGIFHRSQLRTQSETFFSLIHHLFAHSFSA